jgi:regulatory protein
VPSASPDPLDVAFRALAHRDLTRHELGRRLARRGVDEPEREEAIERLAASGYVDDGRFALARARSLAERGRSDAAIRADLEQRGVDAALVAEAIAALEPEAERARAEVARHGGGLRALRALARNGFSEDSVEAAGSSATRDP